MLDIYKHAEIVTICDGNDLGVSTQSIQLSIERTSSDEPAQSFLDAIRLRFVGAQFSRLNINCENIPVGLFVRMIHLLPNLDSLKISSFPSVPSDYLFDDDGKIPFSTSINNKSTKVNLEKTVDLKQVNFLRCLCLRMRYSHMDVLKDMDLQIACFHNK